jgi:FkbM family methyltransferase
MPTLKRTIANILERLSGNLIIPRHEVHLGPERMHLRRFFAYFGVDCVFDVGANHGQYARMLREHVGFTGHIISFEPIPELAQALTAEARADGRWHVEQLALDRESGPTIFHVMQQPQFSSLHRPSADQPGIFSDDNKVARSITVERSTIAAELPRFQSRLGFARPFLKMDTQGNDSAVVQGAGEALEKFVGIQTELAIRRLYEDSAGFVDALADLDRRGFELSAFVPNNAGHFPLLVEMDCVLFRRGAIPQR